MELLNIYKKMAGRKVKDLYILKQNQILVVREDFILGLRLLLMQALTGLC